MPAALRCLSANTHLNRNSAKLFAFFFFFFFSVYFLAPLCYHPVVIFVYSMQKSRYYFGINHKNHITSIEATAYCYFCVLGSHHPASEQRLYFQIIMLLPWPNPLFKLFIIILASCKQAEGGVQGNPLTMAH